MRLDYPLNNIYTYDTVGEFLQEAEARFGDRPAVSVYDGEGKEHCHTYRMLVRDAKALALVLLDMGMAGKHLAIVGENSYEWLLMFLACSAIGAAAIPVDVEQQDEKIWQCIRFGDSCMAAVSREYEFLFQNTRCCPVLYLWDNHDARSLPALLSDGYRALKDREKELDLVMDQVQKEQTAAIIYTSGTISAPKPVMLSHGNIMYNACHAQALVETGTKAYTCLPLYHAYSLVCGALNVLTQGQHLGLNGRVKNWMRDLRLFSPEMILLVPMMMESLIRSIRLEQTRDGMREEAKKALKRYESRKRHHLSCSPFTHRALTRVLGDSLFLIICGGAQLNERLAREFRCYGINVLQGYGVTECGPLICVNRNRRYRENSVGILLPGTRVKIQDGEILVKGPSVFKGYYKAQEETEKAFSEGWFCTGDLGYRDRKGFLYLTGRKKNLVVFSSGKKVVPEELEELIAQIPLVREVMVYGASNGQTADDVKLSAVIYADPQKTKGMTSYEVLERIQEEIYELNKKLPFHKRIQLIRMTEAEFKKTSIQKIRRGRF
ncbi:MULTISPECIES: AMP-binding protein [Blautia]|uniref:AMP-binding protein n=1 Tax=Blautia TaxID=572511 RepID=UPI000BA49B1D|nr:MULTISPECIES: AMP-binding protein [Blautia]